ncbi:MAG TPA: type II toxin-antitoxin system YafQ family toxin [bacterium]|nr:type II toxin-antitoxin system YafQ family toxin [bacterium]
MKKVSQTKQFSRDVKRMRKRGKDLQKLREVVRLLAEGIPLPANYRNHPLIEPWQSSRDCHIEADWILIYTAERDSLRLERTGTHSDLFKK